MLKPLANKELFDKLKHLKGYLGKLENNMKQRQQKRMNEQGNVLFLILIAVALFAALSYAVTQSTRSGGGSADKEKAVLSGASMTQYPASLRTTLIRMVLSGTGVEAMRFNPPSELPGSDPDKTLYVFEADGGSALFIDAPAELMNSSTKGTWFFNTSWALPQIGSDAPTSQDGNEVIAFLPGIKSSVCKEVNKQFSINVNNCALFNGVPTLLTASDHALINENQNDAYVAAFPTDPEALNGNDSGGACQAFTGQPSGCFYDPDVDIGNGGGEFVFYSVLLER